MTENVSTEFLTTLTAGITSSATSLTVAASLPSGLTTPFRAVIWPAGSTGLVVGEIVLVTAVSSLTWTVTRGQETTLGAPAASAHSNGDNIAPVLTAQGLLNVLAQYAQLIESVNTVSASGSAVTIPDVTTATINNVTLTANCTFTFPTAAAGKSFLVCLVQDATGSRTVTWPGTVKWVGSGAPTLTTNASGIDLISFVCVDGTNWLGTPALKFG